jgi:hypothetical protein
MFYQKEIGPAFRFGDVVRGYIATTPGLKQPILSTTDDRYNIDIYLPTYNVIITPCCSIGEKMISLTPLIEVRNSFFSNPYFKEDLTRINRKMEPQQAIPPDAWQKLSYEEKQRRLEEGHSYAFLEFFIYEGGELFPKYIVNRREGNIETNYYMIDFRNTYKLNCEAIKTQKNVPIMSKCLELSLQPRAELRDKLAYYYGRTPKEDEILED